MKYGKTAFKTSKLKEFKNKGLIKKPQRIHQWLLLMLLINESNWSNHAFATIYVHVAKLKLIELLIKHQIYKLYWFQTELGAMGKCLAKYDSLAY